MALISMTQAAEILGTKYTATAKRVLQREGVPIVNYNKWERGAEDALVRAVAARVEIKPGRPPSLETQNA
jgi:hypothetical protein